MLSCSGALYLFCPCVPHGLEKKKKEEEEERKRRFSILVFLASIKLSWNQMIYLYSGGSGLSIDIHFVDLEPS